MGSISNCDKSAVLETAKTVREMILLSLNALQSRDKNAAEKLYEMDDTVDTQYRKYLRDLIIPSQGQEKSTEKLLTDSNNNPRCYISALLILRYLERISDHACYIGDSVHYIVTGVSSPRR
jgi:phosphate transport system protein